MAAPSSAGRKIGRHQRASARIATLMIGGLLLACTEPARSGRGPAPPPSPSSTNPGPQSEHQHPAPVEDETASTAPPTPLRLARQAPAATDSVARLLASAGQALVEQRYAEATEAYDEVLRRQPGMAEATFLVAVCLVQQERLEEALPLFAEAFERAPPLRSDVPRLAAEGLLSDDRGVHARIQSATRE